MSTEHQPSITTPPMSELMTSIELEKMYWNPTQLAIDVVVKLRDQLLLGIRFVHVKELHYSVVDILKAKGYKVDFFTNREGKFIHSVSLWTPDTAK